MLLECGDALSSFDRGPRLLKRGALLRRWRHSGQVDLVNQLADRVTCAFSITQLVACMIM